MEVLLHEAVSSNPQGDGENKSIYAKQGFPPPLVSAAKEKLAKLHEKGSMHLTRSADDKTMSIAFQDISYTVSLGFRKGQKKILHEVNGRLPAGQLVAIMGPSGAGKSTLLDILSGYRLTGVDGLVTVNGMVRDLNTFRRYSAYITQDDRLQPLLTVKENMQVSADLKLTIDTDPARKSLIIEEILDTLGLLEHQNTRAARLSGGQKKRLSIALELVSNPTILFLDEPTTGLDSSSCSQVVNLLKVLARQGRTIVCTIHQPSASLFQIFDQVYLLARGKCLYQGATSQLVPYLESVKIPCPMYHNPADYVIELACGEYGEDKIDTLVSGTQNGKSLQWFVDRSAFSEAFTPKVSNREKKGFGRRSNGSTHATPPMHQLMVLLRRGFVKSKRDTTLTYLRILVNVFIGLMLGSVFLEAGNEASRVLDNYNLLFSILMHHMMTTMMLTILTFPEEMSILQKEHFNRWYSLKAFYASVTIVDFPITVFCCSIFSVIVYVMSGQPLEWPRFSMFFCISFLVAWIAQSIGLMIGAIFDVVNGTFLGPTLSVPIMMFAGFGVSLRDLPSYLKWGSYISYLRYGLEGYVAAIYGFNRPLIRCKTQYCHFKYPTKFLSEISMEGDQFWNDVVALCVILALTRIAAFYLLRRKLIASR